MGRMFDSRTREDLTQKRLDTALRIDFKALPFDQAIKTVRGNGSRTMVTFEDPNCPYCKRLWQNMQQLNNVTIYSFLYPILSPDSQEKSRAIWCAKDRAAAWDNYMVQGKAPAAAAPDCKTPLPRVRHQRHADDRVRRRLAWSRRNDGRGHRAEAGGHRQEVARLSA